MKRADRKKQREFMEAYQPIHQNFVRFCKARTHGVMSFEDLVNEAVMKAYQNWDKIKAKDKLLYFLFSTARNVVLNVIRKKKETSLEKNHEEAFSIDSTAEDDLEIAYLYEQLNKLSDQKREALILFEINGFSIKEIAVLQGMKEGAIKVMLSRARKELKTLMTDQPIMQNVNQTVS